MTIQDFFRRQSDTTIYVGIDPGAEAAVGMISGSRACSVPIPTIKVKRGTGKKTTFDYAGIVKLFRFFNDFREITYVALEVPPPNMSLYRGGSTTSRPSAYGQFRLGIAYGLWPLFLVQKGLSLVEVGPAVWKKHMGLTSDKETSRHTAMKMFPAVNLSLKKDHNRAEALLLAAWLRSKMTGLKK